MASRKDTKTVDHVALAIEHLLAIAKPAEDALAAVAPRRTDAGFEPRRNSALRFVIQGVINSLQHQLTGNMGDFRNITKLRTDSEVQYAELQRKHNGDEDAMVIDPTFARVVPWMLFNQANEECLQHLMQVFVAVGEKIAGTTLKPQPIVTKGSTAMGAALSDAATKAAKEMLAKAKANAVAA